MTHISCMRYICFFWVIGVCSLPNMRYRLLSTVYPIHFPIISRSLSNHFPIIFQHWYTLSVCLLLVHWFFFSLWHHIVFVVSHHAVFRHVALIPHSVLIQHDLSSNRVTLRLSQWHFDCLCDHIDLKSRQWSWLVRCQPMMSFQKYVLFLSSIISCLLICSILPSRPWCLWTRPNKPPAHLARFPRSTRLYAPLTCHPACFPQEMTAPREEQASEDCSLTLSLAPPARSFIRETKQVLSI